MLTVAVGASGPDEHAARETIDTPRTKDARNFRMDFSSQESWLADTVVGSTPAARTAAAEPAATTLPSAGSATALAAPSLAPWLTMIVPAGRPSSCRAARIFAA